jgi:Tol biopolymer transport system component
MLAYIGTVQNTSGRDGSDIFRIRTDGSLRRRLTFSGVAEDPVWSPDGRRIAYVKWGRRSGIWLMGADGRAKRRIIAGGSAPAWAPDGNRISYECESGELCLYDLNTDSSSVVVASTEEWPDASESTWSPNGNWIAFVRHGDWAEYTRNRQLFRVRPDGTGLVAIPNTWPTGTEPAWSPNGRRILYTERDDYYDYSSVWSVRPNGTDKTRLRWSSSSAEVTWAPDGRRIALRSEDTWLSHVGIWTVAPNGTRRQLVVRGGQSPAWRPNFAETTTPITGPRPDPGRAIAFVAVTDAGIDLFSVRPAGTRPRRLTSHGDALSPAWSPNHARIAYVVPGKEQLRVLNVRTEHDRRVASDFEGHDPAWSPNGRRLAWGTWGALSVLNLRTKQLRTIRIRTAGISPSHPTWSPNGRRIAFSNSFALGQSDIMVVGVDGGRPRHVTRLAGAEYQPVWSPDGRRVAFSHTTGPWFALRTRVVSTNLDGRSRRVHMDTNGIEFAPAWSPSSARLALYSDGPAPFAAQPRPGLWVLDAHGRQPKLVVRNRAILDLAW